MKLHLTDEESAFREEMRTFFTTEVPQEIRDTIASGRHVGKDGVVQTQRILNAGGTRRAELAGRVGRQGLDPAAAAHLARGDAARLRAAAAGVQRQHGRPGDRELRLAGAEGAVPAADRQPRHLVVPGLLRARTPAPTSRRCSTKAVRDGDDYVVNGQKTWTTLGQYADWIFVLVRTDPERRTQAAGISFLLIDLKDAGVSRSGRSQLIDGGVEVNEVFFDDVRVPVDHLVGEENKGWSYAKFLLGNERVGVAPVGATKRALARAKETRRADAAARRPAGRGPDRRPRERAARAGAHRAAGGRRTPPTASRTRRRRSSSCKGTELQQAVSELLVDLGGPTVPRVRRRRGLRLPEWARVAAPTYLNLRKASIYGGSNEIQRQIIAGTILGL